MRALTSELRPKMRLCAQAAADSTSIPLIVTERYNGSKLLHINHHAMICVAVVRLQSCIGDVMIGVDKDEDGHVLDRV